MLRILKDAVVNTVSKGSMIKNVFKSYGSTIGFAALVYVYDRAYSNKVEFNRTFYVTVVSDSAFWNWSRQHRIHTTPQITVVLCAATVMAPPS